MSVLENMGDNYIHLILHGIMVVVMVVVVVYVEVLVLVVVVLLVVLVVVVFYESSSNCNDSNRVHSYYTIPSRFP